MEVITIDLTTEDAQWLVQVLEDLYEDSAAQRLRCMIEDALEALSGRWAA